MNDTLNPPNSIEMYTLYTHMCCANRYILHLFYVHALPKKKNKEQNIDGIVTQAKQHKKKEHQPKKTQIKEGSEEEKRKNTR